MNLLTLLANVLLIAFSAVSCFTGYRLRAVLAAAAVVIIANSSIKELEVFAPISAL